MLRCVSQLRPLSYLTANNFKSWSLFAFILSPLSTSPPYLSPLLLILVLPFLLPFSSPSSSSSSSFLYSSSSFSSFFSSRLFHFLLLFLHYSFFSSAVQCSFTFFMQFIACISSNAVKCISALSIKIPFSSGTPVFPVYTASTRLIETAQMWKTTQSNPD